MDGSEFGWAVLFFQCFDFGFALQLARSEGLIVEVVE